MAVNRGLGLNPPPPPPPHTHTHIIIGYYCNTPSLDSLTEKVQERPKYDVLVEHPFIKMTKQLDVDVGAWYRDILDREAALT